MINNVQPGSLNSTLFSITSRYHGTNTLILTTLTGKKFAYLPRRFVPSPEKLALLQEHTVIQGDRLDNITAQYLGDPEQFWRVADANNAMDANELTTTIGRKLRITLPEGIPGQTYA
jgi:hypothetical protein